MPKSPIQPTPADTTLLLKSRLETRPVPPYPQPFFRPPPRPPDETIIKDCWKDLQNFDLDRKVEFEENSPHQEGIISETYKRPDALLIQDPPELQDLIDTSKLIQKFLQIYYHILYHTTLFAGHQSVVKTYLTINDKFFIPGLAHYQHHT